MAPESPKSFQEHNNEKVDPNQLDINFEEENAETHSLDKSMPEGVKNNLERLLSRTQEEIIKEKAEREKNIEITEKLKKEEALHKKENNDNYMYGRRD